MNLNLTEEKSIYLQIGEAIENDILRGVLLEEERVPSTNELAKMYAINPATAGKGVNLLVDTGILYKKRGIGMFVAAGAKARILQKRREEFLKDIKFKIIKNLPDALLLWSRYATISPADKGKVEGVIWNIK